MSSEIHLKFNYPPFSITITICIVKSNYVNGALHFIIEVKFNIQFLIMVVFFIFVITLDKIVKICYYFQIMIWIRG